MPLGRERGATLSMTLLAGFQALLHRATGQPGIPVGTAVANRNRSEIEKLIGFFVNTLVLHTSLAGRPAFGELMARVREVALAAYEHQDMPFDRLVEELATSRDLSRNPLCQVMFSYQNFPRQAPPSRRVFRAFVVTAAPFRRWVRGSPRRAFALID